MERSAWIQVFEETGFQMRGVAIDDDAHYVERRIQVLLLSYGAISECAYGCFNLHLLVGSGTCNTGGCSASTQ